MLHARARISLTRVSSGDWDVQSLSREFFLGSENQENLLHSGAGHICFTTRSNSQAGPGRNFSQPSARLLAHPCTLSQRQSSSERRQSSFLVASSHAILAHARAACARVDTLLPKWAHKNPAAVIFHPAETSFQGGQRPNSVGERGAPHNINTGVDFLIELSEA